jgi:hypothetical protein
MSYMCNEKWYLSFIAINCLFFICLPLTISNSFFPSILQWMLNDKIILIPYLMLSGIGYYLLFVSTIHPETKRKVIYTTILFAVVCAVILTVVGNIPSIDTHSDNDEGLEVFIHSLSNGSYPYLNQVQHVNENGKTFSLRLDFLPALPAYSFIFYLLGNVAYQNIVNVVALVLIVWFIAKSDEQKLLGYIMLVLCLPIYLFELTQSDHLTIATGILLVLVLLYNKKYISASVLSGCMIASKGYFWLVVPAITVFLFKQLGFKKWIENMIVIVGIAAIFIVPFLAWDSNTFLHFAPMGVLASFNSFWIIPYAGFTMPAFYCMVALIAAWKIDNIFITTLVVYLVASTTIFLYVALTICLMMIALGIIDMDSKNNSIDIIQSEQI